jgi:hypothetical protein
VLEDCKGNTLGLRVVVRLIKLDVTATVEALAVATVAGLVTNEVTGVLVAGAVTRAYPFDTQ